MRKIAIIVGSKSDLSQCQLGLKFLQEAKVEVIGVYIRSQHRNTLPTQNLLKQLVEEGVDVIIIGAGWANHLTGCCDAFLRYALRDKKIVVVGVAFRDVTNEKHTQAAILSITEVPGTQVLFKFRDRDLVGIRGFLQACEIAATGELPEITLPTPKETMDLTLNEALEIATKEKIIS
jgi:phosphoribosylcarboxyaminoimidazole (NCAIR) mutase